MRHGTSGDSVTLRALWIGVAVPFLYYGIQAAAAPFFPGFRFVGTTASELGSELSRHRAIFNVGIMVQGAASLIASLGFLLAFRRLGVHSLLAWPTSLAVAMNGVQTLWAGAFPMPDPRHGGHPAFIVFMLALPVLLAASMWGRVDGRGRAFFVASLALLAAMVPVMTRMTGLDTYTYRGLVQRVFTLAIFPPIGVASYLLIRRLAALQGSVASHAGANA
jgi:hypothetical membrane protein